MTIVISAVTAPIERSRLNVDYIEACKREVAKMASIQTLLEVQQRLSRISGSIAREIKAEREDR